MSQILQLSDVGEKNNKVNQAEDYINMTDFYPEDYEKIIKYIRPISLGETSVTVLDLFNIPFEDDEKVQDFIQERLKIDLDSQKGIDKINQIFSQAIDTYKQRYLRKIPQRIEKISFKNKKQIISLLRETKTNRSSGAIICALAKTSFAVNDVLQNEKINRVDFLEEQFLMKYLSGFQNIRGFHDENGNQYRTGTFKYGDNGDDKYIKFRLISRQKTNNSIIGKEIADPKYFSVDKFKDIVGGTFYVENDYEAAILMQYVDQAIYKGQASIVNKNGLNLEEVKKNTYLEESFYLKLEAQTKISKDIVSKRQKRLEEKKLSTADDYREIKLTGMVDLPLENGEDAVEYPIGTEIKFVIGGHDNEKGISLQTIYDYAKKIRELTRLGIPIRKLDLINYVNDFFDNIDSSLQKKNKTKSDYYHELFLDFQEKGYIGQNIDFPKHTKDIEKLLALGLFSHFESMLTKVKLPNSKKYYYFDKRILELSKAGLYKKLDIIE